MAMMLRELFDQASALPVAERPGWLAAHCPDAVLRAEVERLLAADAASTTTPQRDALALAEAIGTTSHTLEPGARIGPFSVDALLGEGGSSTVYRAHRDLDGVRQTVALKVLRRGLAAPDARRQFDRERQALAQLQHPHIAQFIDGGVTGDGSGWLAIEFVDGAPITAYARERSLDFRRRIALMIDVARAVAAAHRSLIVHRDLKPGNVLVTHDGHVKLLDFGIAKLLGEDPEPNRTVTRAFTPAYAAPEQRDGGPITTATDVYALGIVLGELVTGQRLTDGGTATPSSRITDDTAPGVLPAEPKLTRRLVRGDLDNILMKALEEEPERRYATAAAFADDLERLLDGRPVSAHPPSGWYRAQKFVQRHRGGVAVTVLLSLAVLVSLGVAVQQGREARRQADLARSEATRANEQAEIAKRETARAVSVRELLVDLFENEAPGANRAELPNTADLLARGAERARTAVGMDASVQADLLMTIGRIYSQLGRYDKARPLMIGAVEVAESVVRAEPAILGAALSQLGDLERIEHHYADALRRFDSALAIQERIEPNGLATAMTLHRRALVYSETGRHAQALADYDASRALRENLLPLDDPLVIASVGAKGTALARAGRAVEAEPWARRALESARRVHGEVHAETALRWQNLGFILLQADQLSDAEEAIATAIDIQEKVFAGPSRDALTTTYNLGMARLALGKIDEAEASFRRSIEIARAIGTPEAPIVGSTHKSFARIALLRGDLDGAVDATREGARILAKTMPAHHVSRLDMATLDLYLSLMRSPAQDLRTQSRELKEQITSANLARPSLEIFAGFVHGLAEARAGEPALGIAIIEKSVDAARGTPMLSNHEFPLAWSSLLADLLIAHGRGDAARTALERGLADAAARGLPSDHPARQHATRKLENLPSTDLQ